MLAAPAGLGVRESILAIALQPLFLTPPTIIIVVGGARLVTTMAEVFCLLIALGIRYMDTQTSAAT